MLGGLYGLMPQGLTDNQRVVGSSPTGGAQALAAMPALIFIVFQALRGQGGGDWW